MEFVIIAIVSASASLLTLFSGFGLGTILMPAFAVFFPLDIAISLTAVVHLFNNLFKLIIFGRQANHRIVMRFGLPAVVAALAGAWALFFLQHWPSLYHYSLGGRHFEITLIKIVIALIMIGFIIFETLPRFRNLSFDERSLSWGGILSGFFGGLSGHQGALRSMFLTRCGLSKESFIATGVVIACLVDFARLFVYGLYFFHTELKNNGQIVFVATFAAWLGVYVGGKILKKVTFSFIQKLVSGMVVMIALFLGSGLI